MKKRDSVFLKSFAGTLLVLLCVFLFCLTLYRMESSSHIDKTKILAVSVEENYKIEMILFDKKLSLCDYASIKSLLRKTEQITSLFPVAAAPMRILQQLSAGILSFL